MLDKIWFAGTSYKAIKQSTAKLESLHEGWFTYMAYLENPWVRRGSDNWISFVGAHYGTQLTCPFSKEYDPDFEILISFSMWAYIVCT